MNTCISCGERFYPQSPAWGDSICGNCIADRIELELVRGVLLAERKPLRRATGASAPEVFVGAPQTVAAEQRRA